MQVSSTPLACIVNGRRKTDVTSSRFLTCAGRNPLIDCDWFRPCGMWSTRFMAPECITNWKTRLARLSKPGLAAGSFTTLQRQRGRLWRVSGTRLHFEKGWLMVATSHGTRTCPSGDGLQIFSRCKIAFTRTRKDIDRSVGDYARDFDSCMCIWSICLRCCILQSRGVSWCQRTVQKQVWRAYVRIYSS